jgi:hypothetical protein
MTKIRDLGISVIPATMRPPEIGGGGAPQCTDPSASIDSCPEPSGCCGGDKDKDKDKDKKQQPRYAGALTADGVAQLKQQLRYQLETHV